MIRINSDRIGIATSNETTNVPVSLTLLKPEWLHPHGRYTQTPQHPLQVFDSIIHRHKQKETTHHTGDIMIRRCQEILTREDGACSSLSFSDFPSLRLGWCVRRRSYSYASLVTRGWMDASRSIKPFDVDCQRERVSARMAMNTLKVVCLGVVM